MKASDFEKSMDKAISNVKKTILLGRFLKPIFKRLELDVVRRTRLGYGSKRWGGARTKLESLSAIWIKKRKSKKSKLNKSRGSATRSNLTYTAQMLNAYKFFFVKTGLMKIGFTENRNDNKKNAMLAKIHEYGLDSVTEDGKLIKMPARPFINPSSKETKRLRQDLTKSVKAEIIKELRKLK